MTVNDLDDLVDTLMRSTNPMTVTQILNLLDDKPLDEIISSLIVSLGFFHSLSSEHHRVVFAAAIIAAQHRVLKQNIEVPEDACLQ